MKQDKNKDGLFETKPSTDSNDDNQIQVLTISTPVPEDLRLQDLDISNDTTAGDIESEAVG